MASNNSNNRRRGAHTDKQEAIRSVRQQLACAEAHLGVHEYESANDELLEAAVEQVEAAQRQLSGLLDVLELRT